MAGINLVTLASNAGAGNQPAVKWNGGKMALVAEGTFGGGSIKLQLQSPQGTWIDVPSSTLSANGILIIDVPAGQVRAVTATGTAFYAYGLTYLTPTR
jgi:hypothetical protein